jgi:hypothetical protein
VEAVNNAGFKATAAIFNQQVAPGVDARQFLVQERTVSHDGDDYIDNTGGGNNIPPHQMFLAMQILSHDNGLQMEDTSPHLFRQAIGTREFWVGHQWAIVQIPVGGGHWVSMEKIMYMGQPAICLREGRGKMMYDFITSPDDGCRETLPAGMASGKRKR